ncbi:hypothetical protein [Streptomyces sp. NPDC001139]
MYAVAGMQLEGRATGPDTQFDGPVRRWRSVPAAVLSFGLPPQQSMDFRIDALHPQHVPGTQAVQVGRQVSELFQSGH